MISEYQKQLAKLNARTSHEWDLFVNTHGARWDDLSVEAKRIACDLAETQGERSRQLRNKYKASVLIAW